MLAVMNHVMWARRHIHRKTVREKEKKNASTNALCLFCGDLDRVLHRDWPYPTEKIVKGWGEGEREACGLVRFHLLSY